MRSSFASAVNVVSRDELKENIDKLYASAQNASLGRTGPVMVSMKPPSYRNVSTSGLESYGHSRTEQHGAPVKDQENSTDLTIKPIGIKK